MLGVLGEGMKASRDRPVLMITSLVHLWQPGPDVCQVGRTRASAREQQLGEEKVRKLHPPRCYRLRINSYLNFGGNGKGRQNDDDPGGDHGAL